MTSTSPCEGCATAPPPAWSTSSAACLYQTMGDFGRAREGLRLRDRGGMRRTTTAGPPG